MAITVVFIRELSFFSVNHRQAWTPIATARIWARAWSHCSAAQPSESRRPKAELGISYDVHIVEMGIF